MSRMERTQKCRADAAQAFSDLLFTQAIQNISMYFYVTLQTISENVDDERWIWQAIATHPEMTDAFVDKYVHKFDYVSQVLLMFMAPMTKLKRVFDIETQHNPSVYFYLHAPYVYSTFVQSKGHCLRMALHIQSDIQSDIQSEIKSVGKRRTDCLAQFYIIEMIRRFRRHLAAYRIQQHWYRITTNPAHPVCIRRLERQYDQLSSN